MEATAFGDKASEELEGHCGRVESGGALELPVPRLTHHVHDELDAPLVDGVIHRATGPICGVIGLHFTDFGGCCILRDAAVL